MEEARAEEIAKEIKKLRDDAGKAFREAVEREGQWPNQLSFNAALSTATRKVDASLKK